MSGWNPSNPPRPSRPPWETSGQPSLRPDDSYYGRPQGARVIIKPHANARGARPGRGYQQPSEASRGTTLLGVLFGLAASVGLIYGAVQLTHVSWGVPPVPAAAASTPASTPAQSPSPAGTGSSASATPTASGNQALGGQGTQAWALTTPATAGGYPRHKPMAGVMLATGTANATALMQAVVLSGGKPDGGATQPKYVSAEYLVPGSQAIGYVGFTGSFSPASVMDAFGKIADSVSSEPSGSHGGKMSCGLMSANSGPSGTVCVWATTTSLGMVGFFGGDAPEHVTSTRAGEDTAKLRGDAEVAK
jgi:hypothetical protein